MLIEVGACPNNWGNPKIILLVCTAFGAFGALMAMVSEAMLFKALQNMGLWKKQAGGLYLH